MTSIGAAETGAARNAFTKGLLASGISVNGLMASHNEAVAAKMFAAATESDPSMCDAWLARIVAGDDSVAVLAAAWQARETLGWETRLAGGAGGPVLPDGVRRAVSAPGDHLG
jgi:hypothetical protein